RLDRRALGGAHPAGVGEHGVHAPALLLQVGHAEAGVEPTRECQHDVPAHAAPPASHAITAFCTCSRFSASSTAVQRGESITASVALTLRRSGRQCENTASLVSAILASSTMKWR